MSALTPVTVASLVVISTEGAQVIAGKGMSITPVIGGFVLGIMLIGLSGLNDRLGSYMAILVLILAALHNGPILLTAIPKG